MSSVLKIRCPACSSELRVHDPTLGHGILCGRCHHPLFLNRIPQVSHKATASFCLGIVSICLAPLTSIPTFLLGYFSLQDMRRKRVESTGRNQILAWSGIATALLGVAFYSVAAAMVVSGFRVPDPSRADNSYKLDGKTEAIVSQDAEWKWLHPLDGTDPADALPGFHQEFSLLGFDDSEWSRGRDLDGKGFGYGSKYVSIPIGTPAKGERFSAYFRSAFRVDRAFKDLRLIMRVDDGAIIYLDGAELARTNVVHNRPKVHRMKASQRVASSWPTEVRLPDVVLTPGDHVLAISVHNVSPTSSDLLLAKVQLVGDPVE